jgi:hypothetical protein
MVPDDASVGVVELSVSVLTVEGVAATAPLRFRVLAP